MCFFPIYDVFGYITSFVSSGVFWLEYTHITFWRVLLATFPRAITIAFILSFHCVPHTFNASARTSANHYFFARWAKFDFSVGCIRASNASQPTIFAQSSSYLSWLVDRFSTFFAVCNHVYMVIYMEGKVNHESMCNYRK